jgi:hypothetical protein
VKDAVKGGVLKRNQILPTVLIVIDLAAAVGYIPDGEWKRVIYWVAAAVLTWSVTW